MNEDNQMVPLELVSSGAIEAISRAEIDTQIATAKKYPRNIAAVKSQMLTIATMDEETASACFYSLPRGGKNVQGPSVRMAEIALSCYGNVKAGTRILSVETGANPHAVVQAVVHDMEKNVAFSVEKRRRIVGKKKNNGKPDEDDINLAVNAGSAIAFRDAVFKVVPGALVKAVYEAAKKVAVGDIKSLSVQREKIVGRLKQMGAKEDRIFALLGIRKLDEITLEHVETLIGIGTALRDGNITLEEAFPAADAPTPFPRQEPKTAPAPADAVEVPTAPEPAQSAPAPAPEQTSQHRLAALVVGGGYTWDQFSVWATEQGFVTTETCFDELTSETCDKLIAKAKGMLNALAAKNGGAR